MLVVSGGGELGARRLLAEVRGIVDAHALLRGSVTEEGANVVALASGSEVRCVPASEHAIRGWTADLLLVDEAQLVADDLLLGAALPTTAARPDSRVVLAGTASVASGAFYDLCRRGELGGDESVRFSRRVSRLVGGDDLAPWQNPTMIAAQVSAMGTLRSDAEHRCVWASGSDALFTRPVLEGATLDYLPLDLADLRPRARYLGGVDWGQTTDRSTCAVVGRLALPDEADPVFGVACAERWAAGAPPLDVADEIAACAGHFDTLSAETNGLGGPCADRLFRGLEARRPDAGGGRPSGWVIVEEPVTRRPLARPRQRRRSATFHTRAARAYSSAPMKAAGYSSLRLLLEDGRLRLPASATELRRELLTLRVNLTGTGERIEAGAGHDDLADALMLAGKPYRRAGETRWRHLLTELCEVGGLPKAELPPAAADAETVAAPDGLRVPREPYWQSVRGPELSPPPGVPDADDPERPRSEMELSQPTPRRTAWS